MCNFIKGSLSELSKNLNDKDKIITRQHFPDNFELLKEKACFPYEFITNKNIYNKELPIIEKFYSFLKLCNISEKDYNKTLEIYKKLKCKNVKEYLDIYLNATISFLNPSFIELYIHGINYHWIYGKSARTSNLSWKVKASFTID